MSGSNPDYTDLIAQKSLAFKQSSILTSDILNLAKYGIDESAIRGALVEEYADINSNGWVIKDLQNSLDRFVQNIVPSSTEIRQSYFDLKANSSLLNRLVAPLKNN
ncbi:MAG: hypothetical protein ABL925_19430 [Methylococcales bacterium]